MQLVPHTPVELVRPLQDDWCGIFNFEEPVLVAAASKCHKGMHGALTRCDEVEGKWNCLEKRQRNLVREYSLDVFGKELLRLAHANDLPFCVRLLARNSLLD
jgi:hypothetical protein